MTDETEKKILDAALKLFAEKGYDGAKTKAIAEKAGFSEVTLFKRFKTKENLFNSMIIQNKEEMMKDFAFVFMPNEFENQEDFLKTLIKNLAKLGETHFELIKIGNNESNRIPENFIEEFINYLSAYIKNNINSEINHKVFAFTLLSFIYVLLLDQGRTFTDWDEAIEEFINNSAMCV